MDFMEKREVNINFLLILVILVGLFIVWILNPFGVNLKPLSFLLLFSVYFLFAIVVEIGIREFNIELTGVFVGSLCILVIFSLLLSYVIKGVDIRFIFSSFVSLVSLFALIPSLVYFVHKRFSHKGVGKER